MLKFIILIIYYSASLFQSTSDCRNCTKPTPEEIESIYQSILSAQDSSAGCRFVYKIGKQYETRSCARSCIHTIRHPAFITQLFFECVYILTGLCQSSFSLSFYSLFSSFFDIFANHAGLDF